MKYFLFLLLSIGSLSLGAQDKEHNSDTDEMIEAQKVAFFTLKLELTPDEAQVFWPIYNDYSKQKKAIRKNKLRNPNLDEIDENKANELIQAQMENKERSLALDKKYIEKFKEILPAKKVLLLMVLDRKFKEEVLKDLKRRLDHKR